VVEKKSAQMAKEKVRRGQSGSNMFATFVSPLLQRVRDRVFLLSWKASSGPGAMKATAKEYLRGRVRHGLEVSMGAQCALVLRARWSSMMARGPCIAPQRCPRTRV